MRVAEHHVVRDSQRVRVLSCLGRIVGHTFHKRDSFSRFPLPPNPSSCTEGTNQPSSVWIALPELEAEVADGEAVVASLHRGQRPSVLSTHKTTRTHRAQHIRGHLGAEEKVAIAHAYIHIYIYIYAYVR